MVGCYVDNLLLVVKGSFRSYSWKVGNRNMQELAGPFEIPLKGKVFSVFAPECMMQWESSNEDSSS